MPRHRLILALVATVGIAATACTGTAGSPSAATQSSAPVSASAGTSGSSATASGISASASASASAVTGSIAIGYPSQADSGDTPSILALNRLNSAGWQIKPTFFAQPETDFAAVAKGDIQIALGSTSVALAAIQAGGKFHIIATQEGVAWLVVGTPAVTSCDNLAGKRWALHSPAGVSSGYANFWIQGNCSADSQGKIKPVYIPGSENREAALLAGQIDATLLDSGSWADLNGKAAGKFQVIADLAADPTLKKLNSSIIAVNDDYWSQHPEVVVAYLKGLMQAYTDAKADPTLLDDVAKSQNVQWNDTVRNGVVQEFKSGALDPTLSITPESMNLNLQFYTKYSNLKPGLTVEQVANFDPLKQASGS